MAKHTTNGRFEKWCLTGRLGVAGGGLGDWLNRTARKETVVMGRNAGMDRTILDAIGVPSRDRVVSVVRIGLAHIKLIISTSVLAFPNVVCNIFFFGCPA